MAVSVRPKGAKMFDTISLSCNVLYIYVCPYILPVYTAHEFVPRAELHLAARILCTSASVYDIIMRDTVSHIILVQLRYIVVMYRLRISRIFGVFWFKCTSVNAEKSASVYLALSTNFRPRRTICL